MPLSPPSFAFAHRPALWLALLLAAPCAAVAAANTTALTSARALPDASLLAGTCANCHGPDGRPPYGSTIPSLRGQNADHLQQRLFAFKAGQVPDATVMTRLMKGYDSAQIQALARWFASTTNKAQP